MSRDSSVGIASRSGLDGPGIESCRFQWPNGLRRRFAAAGRLLAVRIRIPPGAWMFVLCALYSKGQRQSQDSQHKEVQIKYREPKKKNRGGGEIFCTRSDCPREAHATSCMKGIVSIHARLAPWLEKE
jgi:hypothetical protein